jgi:hypothetical protein
MHTLKDTDNPMFNMADPGSIVSIIGEKARTWTKPVIGIIDGGRLFNPMRDAINSYGIPVFSTCDHGVAALALYLEARLAAERMRKAEIDD